MTGEPAPKGTSSNLHLRDMTPTDAAVYSRLMAVLGYPTSPDAARSRLEAILPDPDYHTFAVEWNGEVCGFVGVRLGRIYELDERIAQVLVLVVDEEMQGKGIGTALLDRAEAWAKEQSAVGVSLVSGNHRLEAHRFYERRGYDARGKVFRKQL